MIENKLTGICLNDLHFGIKESKRLYDETVHIKEFIKDHPELDLIIITGDYFDCKISLVESSCFYAVSFMSELIDLAKQNQVSIRILQGTRSHDLNQLQLFKHYENEKDLDFKVIQHVTEEIYTAKKDATKSFHFLYIPEEYPEDSDEFYSEFKKEKYDAIFGHGTWDFAAPPGVSEKARSNTHSAPVFSYEEWKDQLENGFVIFGHIHDRQIYKNKVFYSGAYTRWNFGDHGSRGFAHFETDGKTYKVNFIDNPSAPTFNTFSIEELNNNIDESSVEVLTESIKSKLEEFNGNIRVDISNLSSDKIEVLREYFSNNENVKLEVKPRKVLSNRDRKEALNDYSKYHYITKRQLPLDKMVQQYCKEDLGKEISLDVINDTISNKSE